MTSGIWREASLEGRDEVQITDLYIRQNVITKEEARLTAIIEVDAPTAWQGMLRISADGLEWMRTVTLEGGKQQVEMDIVIDQPQLWWCRGLGEPSFIYFPSRFGAR